ncbi:DUF4194 domain-containing protein [Teredinibacter sp. KSP-S5-2]|uniref:DUF4194 domain-containing protein n=1 Tax=Teredinibacter sp. KSP-S5-2 TaxID=3034506 RepID=UPI002934B6DE|nr:DUF4194 domain-containing protein [Teredinibacter sp. KSP-S5-2]WNO10827.1 DUF4194 domain-containing protein [Teredinibacter sp. KSP-S5-2]
MLDAYIEEQLKTLNISRNEFSELVIRLLDYGVICRNESQIEATLYDRFLSCMELVESYLSFIAVRLQHDKQFAFVRVYPPGSQVPGLADENDQPFNGGFRTRPTQQEVAVILVLRAEYEKSLREGQIQDDGCSLLSLEGLAIAMNNLLKRTLPESLVERKNIFRRLRQLRLIQFNSEDDLEGDEGWIKIQPAITSFVTDEVMQTLGGDELVEEKNKQANPSGNVFDDDDNEVTPSELFKDGGEA